jgi:hypothetical protein
VALDLLSVSRLPLEKPMTRIVPFLPVLCAGIETFCGGVAARPGPIGAGMNAKQGFVAAFVAAALAWCSPSLAAISFVSSSAALGANDSLLWNQFGANVTQIPNPAAGSTTNGIGVTVSQATGAAYTIQITASSGVGPLFPIGERVYKTDGPGFGFSGGPVTVTFAQGILGFGTVYDAGYYLQGFSGTISAYDAGSNLLGSFPFSAPPPPPGGPGSQLFIGVLDSTAEIRRVVIDGTAAASFPEDFLLGKVLVTSAAGPAPVFQSALSRRVHGAAGTFDIPLSTADVHNPTTEPRQGPAQTIVFTFDKPISAATASITEGTATAGTPTFSGNDVVVGLTGVTDQQYVTVSLTNVASSDGGTGGTGSVRVGFLVGDVNQTRVVSVADLGLVNQQLSQVTTAANFLKDVNASGTLTVADKGITNANLTRALPAP